VGAKIAFYAHNERRLNNDYLFKKMSASNVYVKLAKSLERNQHVVHTLDMYQGNSVPDICIFLDVPPISVKKILKNSATKAIVLLREADMVLEENYHTNRHKEFDLILTWKRGLVDGIKYFHLPSTKFDLRKKVDVKDYFNRKLCTLINSNLSSVQPGELYSTRLNIVKQFEKKHPNDFDLWGRGWDKRKLRIRDWMTVETKIFSPRRDSYRGVAQDKLGTMSQYKFSICFENTCLVQDYISEKIFDSFLAGTVPIYYGASNIERLIPARCFIDYRDFDNFDHLFDFISSMSKQEYLKYISNINSFLHGDKAKEFSLDGWRDAIVGSVNFLLTE